VRRTDLSPVSREILAAAPKGSRFSIGFPIAFPIGFPIASSASYLNAFELNTTFPRA
jgi:hypothetical protein